MGLSDTQQGWLVLISAILIAVGGVSIPAGVPWYVGLVISMIGAIGLAVKEFSGTNQPASAPSK